MTGQAFSLFRHSSFAWLNISSDNAALKSKICLAFIFGFMMSAQFPAHAITITPSEITVTVLQGTNTIVSGSKSFTASSTSIFYFYWLGSNASWITTPNQWPISPEWMWLYACPYYNNYTCTYTVSLNTSALSVGTHTGIAYSSIGNIPVTATVRPAEFAVSPEAIAVAANPNCKATSKKLTVTNSDSRGLRFYSSDDQTWINSANGQPIGDLGPGGSLTTTIGFNTSGLALGTYTGNVYISATGGTTKTVPVTLTYKQPPVISNGNGETTACQAYKASYTLTPNTDCTTTYTFQIGTDPAQLADVDQGTISGSNPVILQKEYTNLQTGKDYYHRLIATNGAGTTYGEIVKIPKEELSKGCGKILQNYSGSGQEGLICETLKEPFTVKATDTSGNPEAGIGIGWQIAAEPQGAGASVTPTNSATSSDGLASSTLKLGSLPGDYTVNATCSACTEGSPQTFTAMAKCPDVPQYYQDDYSDDYDGICAIGIDPNTKKKYGVKPCEKDAQGNVLSTEIPYTIADKGCALTSMGMVLDRYDKNPINLPSLLNTTLKYSYLFKFKGYKEDGAVYWDAVNYITGGQVKFKDEEALDGHWINNVQQSLSKSEIDQYLDKCSPVVVKVKRIRKDGSWGWHWVVVTGKSETDYKINDPAGDYNFLSQYGDIYSIRAYENQGGGCK